MASIESGRITGPLAARRLWRRELRVTASAPGFTDITVDVESVLAEGGAGDGLLSLFLRHTSASLTIQENADPSVLADLADALAGLAPQGPHWRHGSEGPDDMPAHVRTMLTDVSLTLPVADGRMMLGTWQGIYLIEHRTRPRARIVVATYIGS